MSTLVRIVTTQCCASGRERHSGRLYESGYKKRIKRKKRYLIDVQFFTDKKLFTIDLWHRGLKHYILYYLENDNCKRV